MVFRTAIAMQTGMREDTGPILFDDFPNVVATIAIALATAIAIVPDDILRVSFTQPAPKKINGFA